MHFQFPFWRTPLVLHEEIALGEPFCLACILNHVFVERKHMGLKDTPLLMCSTDCILRGGNKGFCHNDVLCTFEGWSFFAKLFLCACPNCSSIFGHGCCWWLYTKQLNGSTVWRTWSSRRTRVREYNLSSTFYADLRVWYRIWCHLVLSRHVRFDNTKCVAKLSNALSARCLWQEVKNLIIKPLKMLFFENLELARWSGILHHSILSLGPTKVNMIFV